MKKTFIFLLFMCLTFYVKATEPHTDTSYWKSKYESAIGFSQTALYNWAKGGEKTSISSNIILNIFKDYSKKNFTSNNYIGIAYGVAKMQSIRQLRKTDDKINFLTKVGLSASKRWDYTGFIEFRSQFSE